MALTKNESRSVSTKKVENGFIITLETQKQNSKGETEWETKTFVSESATDASKMAQDLLDENDAQESETSNS